MPRSVLTDHMMRMGPHSGAHRVALRAAISVAVPLLTLWFLGHVDWAVYAAFGSFTALYGRTSAYGPRLRMQLTAGLVFIGCIVAGTVVGITPERSWLVIPLAAVIAVGASMLSDRQLWHPAGPLFPIFAFTACASIPSTPADLGIAAGVATASAGWAIVVGLAGAILPGRQFVNDPLPRGPMLPRHAIRSGVSVALAGTIATAAGIGHPYWAMVSSVVPLSPREFSTQVARGLLRIIGTFGGIAVAWLILTWQPPTLVLLVIVIILQFAGEMLIGRNYALALLAITPLALVMIHLASPTPVSALIGDRAIETVIGVAIGIAVAFLTRRPWRLRRHGATS